MEQWSILGSISDFLPDPWPNDLCLFPAALGTHCKCSQQEDQRVEDKFGWAI